MLTPKQERLALALITLAGVLLSSSCLEPESGRVILRAAIEALDRRPGADRDLAGWLWSAKPDGATDPDGLTADQAGDAAGGVAAAPWAGVSDVLLLSKGLPSGGLSLQDQRAPMPLAGQWHLTCLPPPAA